MKRVTTDSFGQIIEITIFKKKTNMTIVGTYNHLWGHLFIAFTISQAQIVSN